MKFVSCILAAEQLDELRRNSGAKGMSQTIRDTLRAAGLISAPDPCHQTRAVHGEGRTFQYGRTKRAYDARLADLETRLKTLEAQFSEEAA
jgi:hypothetical protein